MRLSTRTLICFITGTIGLMTGLSRCSAAILPSRFSARAILDEIKPQSVATIAQISPHLSQQKYACNAQKPSRMIPNFLVFGGGGAPSYNEIAIEKNVLYFQRTLKALKVASHKPDIYFANGNDGKATIRFINPETTEEEFKVPEIPGLLGPATWGNMRSALAKTDTQKPLFFYFTGHGDRNPRNFNNNTMILWREYGATVQEFTRQLDKLPTQQPVVTVMVQCFSGAFANFIYEKGDPKQPVALQTRCGFFATIKQRPSVGCTPLVNEADYEDYSSSFFAGLSGVNRIGQPVASADYDKDGRVSYREAHAFAKVDEQATDLPISTSEAWLRDRISRTDAVTVIGVPMDDLITTARPEQKYVVQRIAKQYDFDLAQSFLENVETLSVKQQSDEQIKTYLTRLQLELINIRAEQQVRESADKTAIAVLDRLLKCEAGSWK